MSRIPEREVRRIAEQAFALRAPTVERVTRVRTALLDAAAEIPTRPEQGPARPWIFVAAALAAGGVGAMLWWAPIRSPEVEPSRVARATVTASGNATFRRVAATPGRREIVRLAHGRIRVDGPLEMSAPIVVASDDAQIDVGSSSAEVSVHQGRLLRVTALTGRVVIRRGRRPAVVLEAGETWSRSEAPAPEAKQKRRRSPLSPQQTPPALEGRIPAKRGQAERAQPARRTTAQPDRGPTVQTKGGPLAKRAPVKGTAPPGGSARATNVGLTDVSDGVHPTEEGSPSGLASTPKAEPESPAASAAEGAFQRGWRRFSRGDYRTAAEAFAEADVPGSPVLEDARYWRAVALVKADARGPADLALRRFVDLHPTSSRTDEAALLLARLRLLAADYEGARPWLQQAARSTRPTVRRRAEALLRRVGEQQ